MSQQAEKFMEWIEEINSNIENIIEIIENQEIITPDKMAVLSDLRDKVQDELLQTEENGPLTIFDEILDHIFAVIDAASPQIKQGTFLDLLKNLDVIVKKARNDGYISLETRQNLQEICNQMLDVYVEVVDIDKD